jgi:hypothetical protein
MLFEVYNEKTLLHWGVTTGVSVELLLITFVKRLFVLQELSTVNQYAFAKQNMPVVERPH